jgi:hypothetical protein
MEERNAETIPPEPEETREEQAVLGNASYEMAHGSKTQGRKVLNS